ASGTRCMVLDAAPGCVTLLPRSGDRRVRLHRQSVAAEELPAIADRRALSDRPRRVHPAGVGDARRNTVAADLGGHGACHSGRVPDPAAKGGRELRATCYHGTRLVDQPAPAPISSSSPGGGI